MVNRTLLFDPESHFSILRDTLCVMDIDPRYAATP